MLTREYILARKKLKLGVITQEQYDAIIADLDKSLELYNTQEETDRIYVEIVNEAPMFNLKEDIVN